MKRVLSSLLVLGFCLALTNSASARECEGVTMPNSVTIEGTRLVLNGMGIREATVLSVNVYVAGLYLPARSNNGNQIASNDTHRRITLKFVRDVERADIVNAFRDGFRNAGGAPQAHVNALLRRMRNAAEDDTWHFTYVPGNGTAQPKLILGGRLGGTIEGADVPQFARAFFSIWLGSSPPNPGLKTGLLGGECG
jgi:hypothetical protein